MPNLLTRQHLEKVSPEGWLYLVVDNKDYRIKVADLLKLVTKEAIGLGKAENTSDAEKPISNAVREALLKKVSPQDLDKAVASLVGRPEFEAKLEDLTARIQALIDRKPDTPAPAPTPEPALPSIELKDVVAEITKFWTRQTSEGGDFRRVDNSVTTLKTQGEALGKQIQELEVTVANIPRVTDAAKQADLAALGDRVNALAKSIREPENLEALKQKVEGLNGLPPRVEAVETKLADLEPKVRDVGTKVTDLEPKLNDVETKFTNLEPKVREVETKLTGLDSWQTFKTEHDRVAEKAQTALDKANSIKLEAATGGIPSPDVFLTWVRSLQYTKESSAAFGAIAWHDTPATYYNEKPYYKIDPYFASMAVYYGLESSSSFMRDVARNWLNWWMKNQDLETGSTLIHYTDGESIAKELDGANPVVPANSEDATDSNIAMFILALERYVSYFGTGGLYAGWNTVLNRAYDKLNNPALRDTDNTTWAKTGYRVKYLMDNVEVYAALVAATSLFALKGDVIRKQSASEWEGLMQTTLLNDWYDKDTKRWHHTKNEDGNFVADNPASPYPDGLAQVWPSLFGLHGDLRDAVTITPTNWYEEGINTHTHAVDAQIALHVATFGNLAEPRKWLTSVAIARQNDSSFTWPFTCADAAVTSVVAKLVNSAEMIATDRRMTALRNMIEDLRLPPIGG